MDGQFGFYGSASGNDRADFLFGTPTYYEQFPRGTSSVRSHQYAVFFQDEWKVMPRLVLTLGIRYQYDSPKSDPQNRQYMLIPGSAVHRRSVSPLGLLFAGDPGSAATESASLIATIGRRASVLRGIHAAMERLACAADFGVFYDVLLGQDNQYQNGTVPLFAAAYIGCFNGCAVPSNPPAGRIWISLRSLRAARDAQSVPFQRPCLRSISGISISLDFFRLDTTACFWTRICARLTPISTT